MAEQPTTPSLIESLREGASALRGKDLLLTWDHGVIALKALLDAATLLERAYRSGKNVRCFDAGLAISIFRDNSTRTRFAWSSAASLLGLTVQDLDEKKSQLAHGETVRETANNISYVAKAIGIRDDMFVHEGHRYMVELAQALDDGTREGSLPFRPTVVNLQCDVDHPTQSLSDLLHLADVFGGLAALRGKKMAMTWAYSPSYGKPLSVPQGIIGLMTRFGVDVTLAYPEGYALLPETLDVARRNAESSGSRFEVTHSMEEAFTGADIVCPKSWAPFHVMEERTRLLRAGKSGELESLEREALENNARFQSWECNERMMRLTRDGRALYMHPLPADISGVSCKAGEVSKEVFERYRIRTYQEASHKPYVIAAMLLLSRNPDPVSFLTRVFQ